MGAMSADIAYRQPGELEVELKFCDIENIHAMRKSIEEMHAMVFAATQEHGPGRTLEPRVLLAGADSTRWLRHIQVRFPLQL